MTLHSVSPLRDDCSDHRHHNDTTELCSDERRVFELNTIPYIIRGLQLLNYDILDADLEPTTTHSKDDEKWSYAYTSQYCLFAFEAMNTTSEVFELNYHAANTQEGEFAFCCDACFVFALLCKVDALLTRSFRSKRNFLGAAVVQWHYHL